MILGQEYCDLLGVLAVSLLSKVQAWCCAENGRRESADVDARIPKSNVNTDKPARHEGEE
jgi:hypothetical protein